MKDPPSACTHLAEKKIYDCTVRSIPSDYNAAIELDILDEYIWYFRYKHRDSVAVCHHFVDRLDKYLKYSKIKNSNDLVFNVAIESIQKHFIATNLADHPS